MPAGTQSAASFGVPGANIANSVAGGIKIPSTGTGTSGGASSPVVPNAQQSMGLYVQDTLNPSGDDNYIGVNTNVAWKTNVLGEDITDVVRTTSLFDYINDNATRGGKAAYAKAGGTIALDGRCTKVAATGIMTADVAGAYVCKVTGGVVLNDYAWFPEFA